jgi:hypothetical protein
MLGGSAWADYYFREVDEDFCDLQAFRIRWMMVKVVGRGALKKYNLSYTLEDGDSSPGKVNPHILKS